MRRRAPPPCQKRWVLDTPCKIVSKTSILILVVFFFFLATAYLLTATDHNTRAFPCFFVRRINVRVVNFSKISLPLHLKRIHTAIRRRNRALHSTTRRLIPFYPLFPTCGNREQPHKKGNFWFSDFDPHRFVWNNAKDLIGTASQTQNIK